MTGRRGRSGRGVTVTGAMVTRFLEGLGMTCGLRGREGMDPRICEDNGRGEGGSRTAPTS